MEAVNSWTREFFLANQDECYSKLKSLSAEEKSSLRENLEQNIPNKMVYFIGMIYDSCEPEFYCEKYEVKSSDGSIRIEPGKFCDKLNVGDNEEVENPSKYLSERQTVVVSTPNSRNQWVIDAEIQAAGNPNKRKLMEKKDLERSFTVKIYDNVDRPVNSVVEVFGFLTTKQLSEITPMETETDPFADSSQNNLPAHLIHAVAVIELPHSNPILHEPSSIHEEYSHDEMKKDLLKLFTQFMFGDEVAAQYLLLHFISNVYARVGGEVLGKFSLNLICRSIPKDFLADHIKKFVNLVELLVPDSLYVPLTIENFNTKSFVPKKDYKTNRLVSGLLQLPKHTQLILDETKLESGKLEASGCLAVGDLSELIKSQQVHYDFQFYKIPFHTNLPILIFSEGKSMLPSDFLVHIKPEPDSLTLVNENIAAAVHFIKPKLNIIRRYLTECRCRSDFEIGEAETKMIETDFVKMREETNLQVEHLHSLLVISRLIGIAKGLKCLDMPSWVEAKNLEIERINRVEMKANES